MLIINYSKKKCFKKVSQHLPNSNLSRTRMRKVETTKPCQELSRPARKILSSVFTSVFPSRRVHSSKFPVFLSGLITLAYLFSSSSPAS